jgi:endonuclease YncB( thermonuclease family)
MQGSTASPAVNSPLARIGATPANHLMAQFHPRIDTPPLTRNGRRARFGPVLPWVFIMGVAIGVVAGNRYWHTSWQSLPRLPSLHVHRPARSLSNDPFWRNAGNLDAPHPVTVLRTIDGDTFEARVALSSGATTITHVRLRGIDAPELHARCADEFRRAEAAAEALDALLREGGVTISNIGQDKYPGRIDANVATSRTPDVSATLLAGGYARAYDGGRRESWCN